MKRLTLIAVFLCFISSQAYAKDVALRILNVDTYTGQIVVSVFDTKDSFLRQPKKTMTFAINSREEDIRVVMSLQKNKHCLTFSVIHDIDKNQELNTNLFGVPTEPYGFSNNPDTSFGPPSFEEACVAVHGAPIAIHLSD